MNIVLWILQIVLALAFLAAGALKASQPKEKLAERMAWVNHFSASAVRGIGLAEVAGGLGLVLPRATGIAPVLTGVAGLCLAALMAGAALTHIRLKDPIGEAVPSIVLGVLSLVVGLARL